MSKQKKTALIICASILGFLLILFVVCAIYVSDFYEADDSIIGDTSGIRYLDDGSIVIGEGELGFIFYPGGKVEAEAYVPLMREIAKEGVVCVIAKMPFKLAIFDINSADDIRAQFPTVKEWAIGGHSLGGSSASMHIEKSDFDYKALVLLGSYSTSDLTGEDIEVISIYGSEDKVLNSEKYEECVANLPESYLEVVIYGGTHAQFGAYGAQKGDGTPTISREEQISFASREILNVIK